MATKITSKKVDEMQADIHNVLGDASDTHALCTSIALVHELLKPENAAFLKKYNDLDKAIYDKRVSPYSDEFEKRCDAHIDYVEELITKLVPEHKLYVWRLPSKSKSKKK